MFLICLFVCLHMTIKFIIIQEQIIFEIPYMYTLVLEKKRHKTNINFFRPKTLDFNEEYITNFHMPELWSHK